VRQKQYSITEIVKEKGGELPLLLVLDQIQDPGNLGTIVRTAEGAGVTGIVMSQDCVDMYNPKVVRSTMGAAYRVPFCYVDDLAEEVKQMKEAGICTYAAHLGGKNSYDEEDYRKASAFLIGNEGNGLRDEVADQAQVYIRIPMKGQVESLNAAVATAILTFEAARQRR
jgi:TrmH family RNA methyltransferase